MVANLTTHGPWNVC